MQKVVVNVRPVHGLIFLFHWKQEPNEEEVELSCPENLWFANQVIDNSCASLALLNIILNVPDLDIGDHLSQFREFTKDFSPPVSLSFLYRGRIDGSYGDWR
jgi:ubiquitin carboxyl-terminal hydrolase L5